MKLVFEFIMNTTNLEDQTVSNIRKIYEKIQENQNSLPSYFSEGFKVLYNDLPKGRIHKNIQLYYDSLRNIHLKYFSIFRIQHNINDYPRFLNEIISKILIYFDEITCSHKYLKHLIKENDKNYRSGSVNKYKLITGYLEHDTPEKTHNKPCNFVFNIYMYSIRAQNVIYDYESQVESQLSKYDYTDIKKIFETILKYSILVFSHEKKNGNFMKLTYNIATLLKNETFDSKGNEVIIFLCKRILNIVRMELNFYRIKYCINASRSKYLFFNFFIDSNNVVDDYELNKFMDGFIQARYKKTYDCKNLNLDKTIHPMKV